MPATTQQLHDLAVGHRIQLGRYSNTIVRDVIALLNRTDADIVARITRGDFDIGNHTRVELELLLDEVRQMTADAWAALGAELGSQLDDLAGAEQDFSRSLVETGAVQVNIQLQSMQLTTAQVVAAVKARPFQGRFLADWLKDTSEAAQRRVRDAIRQGFVESQSIDEIVRRIRGTRAAQYRDGILEINRRSAEALVRTAITHTSSVAANLVYQDSADVIEAIVWVATLDSRTTLICIGLDGKTFPLDGGPRPPAHVNCLVPDSLVSTAHNVSGCTKRWYEGDVVVVRTAGGKKLTCTPNHPILTDRGWVAAGLLDERAHVVCDAGIKRVALVDDEHQHMESRIEDVAGSLFRDEQMATMPVPTTAEDFHGDGADGEVAIVAADRRLLDDLVAARNEHFGKVVLGRRGVCSALVTGARRLLHLLLRPMAAASGLVGRGRQSPALFGTNFGHPGELLFVPVPWFMAPLCERLDDGVGRAAKVLGNGCDAGSTEKHPLDFYGVQKNAALPGGGPQLHPSSHQLPMERGGADAELARDIIDGLSGPVALDRIVQIERLPYSGHVYNLETAGGWYVSDGIVTHNCRSTTAPLLKGMTPFGRTTYPEWFKSQPAEAQREILGATRQALYAKGGLKLDSFTDDKQHVLTLDELRRKDASAFARAGV